MENQDPLKCQLTLPEVFTREYLLNYKILPLGVESGTVRVAAFGDPDVQALDDVALVFDAQVELVDAPEHSLKEAIQRAIDARQSVVEMVGEVNGHGLYDAEDVSLSDVKDLANQPPVVRYVSMTIRDAHAAGASDIHLEADQNGPRVRFRVDGVLAESDAPPLSMYRAVVSRIKLLADLDIAEKRIPQDGRIRVRLEDRELDLRISTMPSLHGEGVVMRLLDHGGRPVELEELGMNPEVLDSFAALVRKPNGIILVTGPTGSGKTTSLYSALALRDTTKEKVITVEDPVEFQLPGINQVPVNVKAGLDFSTVLRSVLRHDPDVVMVGEMRDSETADIAIRAAMTGHLVFSTLHTNDAVSVIPRLMDLRVEDYLVASTLEGVLAQRLVRQICSECCTGYSPDPQTVALLAGKPVGAAELLKGKGCGACRGTGYRGRTGIFEFLVVDEEMKEALARHPTRAELRSLSVGKGMRTLRDDGWAKVQAGVTTIEEVMRVTID